MWLHGVLTEVSCMKGGWAEHACICYPVSLVWNSCRVCCSTRKCLVYHTLIIIWCIIHWKSLMSWQKVDKLFACRVIKRQIGSSFPAFILHGDIQKQLRNCKHGKCIMVGNWVWGCVPKRYKSVAFSLYRVLLCPPPSPLKIIHYRRGQSK